MTRRCRLCGWPFIEGEAVVDDLDGYWAHHPKLHACCADGTYQGETIYTAQLRRGAARRQAGSQTAGRS